MGCYGIGVGRNLACVIEENSDENGICMPISIAPFKVHITPIRYEDEKVKKIADSIYKDLIENNIETLIDDRECTPGVKFADADLMGMPIRIVVSPRSLEKDLVEIKLRKTGEVIMCELNQIISKINSMININ